MRLQTDSFLLLKKKKQEKKTKQSESFPPSDIQLVHWGVSQGQKRMTDMACNSITKMYAFVKMPTSVSILARLRILTSTATLQSQE